MADKLANRVTCYAGGSDEGSGHSKDPDSLINTIWNPNPNKSFQTYLD